MSNLTHVMDETFESEVLHSEIPVLVDFYADWCGPCKAIAPVLEQIAEDYESDFRVVKLNVDDNTEIASKYKVQSITTLSLFKSGEEVERIVGAVPKEVILNRVRENLLADAHAL